VFLLSPKSCASPWTDSGDWDLDFGVLTAGAIHPDEPGHTGLIGASNRSIGADPSWVFAWLNIWVSSLLSRVATVSSLGQFGAR
jgi:hypothetical protein